jgi:hypothetical protein
MAAIITNEKLSAEAGAAGAAAAIASLIKKLIKSPQIGCIFYNKP